MENIKVSNTVDVDRNLEEIMQLIAEIESSNTNTTTKAPIMTTNDDEEQEHNSDALAELTFNEEKILRNIMNKVS